MSWKLTFPIVLVIALVLSGCTAVQPAAQAPAAADATAAAADGGKVMGKFYWVQNSAWHPVHQYTQQGFLEGCAELGLDCELATTDENSIDALVALADQVVSKPDAKGVAMWFGGLPVAKPIIEKAKANGVAVALPHFPVTEGFYADNAVQIAADTTKYPDPVAKAMCDELTKQGVTSGSVAVTENNHNATEDMVAKVFTEGMAEVLPQPDHPARRTGRPGTDRRHRRRHLDHAGATPTSSPRSPPPAAAPPPGPAPSRKPARRSSPPAWMPPASTSTWSRTARCGAS